MSKLEGNETNCKLKCLERILKSSPIWLLFAAKEIYISQESNACVFSLPFTSQCTKAKNIVLLW